MAVGLLDGSVPKNVFTMCQTAAGGWLFSAA
jgi:hypothetical protein